VINKMDDVGPTKRYAVVASHLRYSDALRPKVKLDRDVTSALLLRID